MKTGMVFAFASAIVSVQADEPNPGFETTGFDDPALSLLQLRTTAGESRVAAQAYPDPMPDMNGWIPGKSYPRYAQDVEEGGRTAGSFGIAGTLGEGGRWRKASSKEECLSMAQALNAQLPMTSAQARQSRFRPNWAANGVSYVYEGPHEGACVMESCWNPLVAGPGDSGIADTERMWEARGTVAQFHVAGGWVTCGPGCFGEIPEKPAKWISEACDYSWWGDFDALTGLPEAAPEPDADEAAAEGDPHISATGGEKFNLAPEMLSGRDK